MENSINNNTDNKIKAISFSISEYTKNKETIVKYIKKNDGIIDDQPTLSTMYLVIPNNFMFPYCRIKSCYQTKLKYIKESSLLNGTFENEKLLGPIFGKKRFSVYPSKADLTDDIKQQIENNKYIEEILQNKIDANKFRDDVFDEVSYLSNYSSEEYGSMHPKVHYVICLVQPPSGYFNSKKYDTLVTLEWFFDCLILKSFINPEIVNNLYTYPH